jgi:RNA polymerase sigma-70 factor (ECF subfamily)
MRRIGIPDPTPSTSPPEGGFATSFRAGEISAADRLITSYGSRAYGLARAILEDDEAAQDAASDALRMVLEQRDVAPDDFVNAGRWWINVTRRASLDRRRGRLHDANSTRDFVPGVSIDQRAVLSAMLAIPAEQREALSLAYQDGLTVVELARRLQVPVPIVVLRLRDAMTVISTALAPPERGTTNDNAE